METRRKPVLIAALVIGAVIGGLAAAWYIRDRAAGHERRAWILSMLPERPDPAGLPPPLAAAIDAACRQVESGDDPVGGAARLVRLYQANGYLNQAIQGLDLMLQADPANPLWPHLLAFNLAGYGQLEVALELWEKTIALEPDYLGAHLRRAEALLKLNRPEEARDAFMVVLIKDPRNANAHQGLARVEIARDNYPRAHELLARAMEYSGGNVGIQLLVTVLERLGRAEEAAAVRGMAKTLEGYSDIPDPWVLDLVDACYDPYQLVSAAGYAVFAGDTGRGVQLMKRAIQYDPGNATAHYQLGVIYRQAGRADEAIASFQKASDLNPNLSDAWLFRALLYIDRGSVERGEELLATGLAHNPNSPALHLAWGQRLAGQNRTREAVREFERSIELRPQEPEAYLEIARIHLRQEDYPAARTYVLQSLEAEAANPVGLMNMVIISIALGDQPAARDWLRKVDRQPRIKPQERRELARFFEQAFGAAP